MAGYRLYFFGLDGRIFAFEAFEAETDVAALTQANLLAGGANPHSWELWRGSHRVHAGVRPALA